MKNIKSTREQMLSLLNTISEYHKDLAPHRKDSEQDLFEKYFYWVDEYNDGYDPRHIKRPQHI